MGLSCTWFQVRENHSQPARRSSQAGDLPSVGGAVGSVKASKPVVIADEAVADFRLDLEGGVLRSS